jgi:hypothetical protein
VEKMEFPALKMEDAIGILTQAAYGEKLKNE